MLSAHYDSVDHSPGASDDGSGVVTLLETARALLSGTPLLNDVLLVFTDNEESLLQGAVAFIDGRTPVGIVLNFEARGSHGPVALFESSQDNGALIPLVARSVAHPVAHSLFNALTRILPNDTDFTVFNKAGIAGLNFAYANGLDHYHTERDDLAHLDPRSVQHHGDYALSLVRTLGNQELPLPARASRVYFDFLGRVLIQYPPWGAALAGLGLLLLTLLLWRRFAPELRLRKQRVVQGVGVFGIALFLALAVVGGFATLAGRALDWLTTVHYVYFAWGFFVTAMGVMAGVFSFSWTVE